MSSGGVITVAEPRALPDRPLPRPVEPGPRRIDAGPQDLGPAASVDGRSSAPPAFDLASAYDEHASALFGFAVNALRDRQLAEDCVQETFLRAWRARDRYDGGRASTRTWLFAIERNVIIDVQRAIQRAPRITSSDTLDEVADETTDPLERLRLAEAVASLSDEHRAVVVAVHLRGGSYAELSNTSGVPVATLRTRAFYALRSLRVRLGGRHE